MGDFEDRLAEGYAAKMKGAAMTPEHEQSIREAHVPSTYRPVYCIECDRPWPCDTAVVLAALDEARAELGAALRGGKSLGSALAAERDAALAREQALRSVVEAAEAYYDCAMDDPVCQDGSSRWLINKVREYRQHDEATR